MNRKVPTQEIICITRSCFEGVKDEMIIETERLLLREYTMDDFAALYEIMSDAETMQHYHTEYEANKITHVSVIHRAATGKDR